MSYINQDVLGIINQYRTTLDQQLNGLLQWIYTQNRNNLFSTNNFKLYSLITENIRMDLNYLVSLNPDFDFFGFPGMQRNIRNTIEAFYDLYNLTFVQDYLSILKYTSRYCKCNSDEYKTVTSLAKEIGLERKENQYGKEYYSISIKAKADIAFKHDINSLSSGIYELLKSYSTDANAFVHPDILVPICNDKAQKLEELLDVDCLLLAHSYNLLVVFVNKMYGYTVNFNPYIEYQNLSTLLSNYKGNFILNHFGYNYNFTNQ